MRFAVLVNLLAALRDFAFPEACLCCGRRLPDRGPFCPACHEEVTLLTAEADAAAKNPRPAEPAFLDGPPKALALYQGPVAQAVRDFKYRRQLAGGAALARWLAREIPPAWLDRVDMVAPVPLHPRRLLSRGFNQAAALFEPLTRERGLVFAPRLLVRLRHTKPQVSLSPQERRGNVAGAFGVRPGQRVAGKNVLIVDDVLTTGATAAECRAALKLAGAAGVGVLTVARAAEGAAQAN